MLRIDRPYLLQLFEAQFAQRVIPAQLGDLAQDAARRRDHHLQVARDHVQRVEQGLDGAAHVAHVALLVGHAEQDLGLGRQLLVHAVGQVAPARVGEDLQGVPGGDAAAGVVHHRHHDFLGLLVEALGQAGAHQAHAQAGRQAAAGAHRRHRG
ncbi:MAG TPA: hypothetical protein DEP03_07085, partial [Massilia sp.]|nr:hypothetical protein [Massilia sp.]